MHAPDGVTSYMHDKTIPSRSPNTGVGIDYIYCYFYFILFVTCSQMVLRPKYLCQLPLARPVVMDVILY